MIIIRAFAIFFALSISCEVAWAADPLPRAAPDEVGISAERLNRISATLKADVAAGRIPGAVVAIARHGRLVMLEAYGWRDKVANLPMTTDTIFNLNSMTKPLTTVGALMLVEQGRIRVGDFLSTYFPQFADTQVAVFDANGDLTTKTEGAKRKITIQDLMRHTSGLVYGRRGTLPEGSPIAARDYDGIAFMDKLASLPLLHQPGTVWDYGFGLDVLGLIIEKVTGKTLAQYLTANLFDPLGMRDTGFAVPPEKAARYAKPLPTDPVTGKQQIRFPELTQPENFNCGGGCSASTAADYLLFATMLMNRGHLNGRRLLSPKTVDYMVSDQIGANIKNLVGNADPSRADYGFGLSVAVRTTPGIAQTIGTVGQYGWPGASGTDFWVDPKEELIVVYLSAAVGPRLHYRQEINALVYQALKD